jgi:hypothetical protein
VRSKYVRAGNVLGGDGDVHGAGEIGRGFSGCLGDGLGKDVAARRLGHAVDNRRASGGSRSGDDVGGELGDHRAAGGRGDDGRGDGDEGHALIGGSGSAELGASEEETQETGGLDGVHDGCGEGQRSLEGFGKVAAMNGVSVDALA